MYNFTSYFAPFIESFITFKTNLNYSAESYNRVLKKLDTFIKDNYATALSLNEDIVKSFIIIEEKILKQNGLRAELICVRVFAKYLRFIGEKAYLIPMELIPKRQQYTPHLYTDKELNLLFTAMDNMPEEIDRSNITIPVLFRLMYCCAMRPGEPIRLLRDDINLETGSLFIKNTKRHSNRVITLNNDLIKMCKIYDNIMGPRKMFFHCTCDTKINSCWAASKLKTCWHRAGLGPRPSSPRPYDFRHTACSNIILKWLNEGKDIMVMLPYLQAHMGHKDLGSTLYYVHMIPEKILIAKGIDWNRFNGLITKGDF
jgi:integrase